jgi:hypothetical protein
VTLCATAKLLFAPTAPELVATMENIGNKRANEHWEHDVPASVVRPREGDMRCDPCVRAAACLVLALIPAAQSAGPLDPRQVRAATVCTEVRPVQRSSRAKPGPLTLRAGTLRRRTARRSSQPLL